MKFAASLGKKKKKWSGGERAADGSIWYLDTRQESVKNHPVHSGSSSEPQQPLRREKIRDLREGMEKKKGGLGTWKIPRILVLVPLWVSEVENSSSSWRSHNLQGKPGSGS